MTLYQVLNVPADATPEQIKVAHRKRVKETHPDKSGGNKDEFRKVQHAFEVLSDQERRTKYDATGDHDNAPQKHSPVVIIATIFKEIMEKCSEHDDVILIMKTGITDGIREMRKGIEKTEKQMKKLNTMKERLSRKEGEALLEAMLQTEIEQGTQFLKALEANILLGQQAQKIVETYKYDAPLRRSSSQRSDLNELIYKNLSREFNFK